MIKKLKELLQVEKSEIKSMYIHDMLEKTDYVTTAAEIVADRCVLEIYKSEFASKKQITCKGTFAECKECWTKFIGE